MVLPSDVLSALAAFGRSNPDFDFTGVTVEGSGQSWWALCKRTLWSDDRNASTEIDLQEWAPDPLNALCFLADEMQEAIQEFKAEIARDRHPAVDEFIAMRQPCDCPDCG